MDEGASWEEATQFAEEEARPGGGERSGGVEGPRAPGRGAGLPASLELPGNHRGTACPGMAQGLCLLTGLQGWAFKAADCKLQEGVLLAHPVHCGSGCRRQL